MSPPIYLKVDDVQASTRLYKWIPDKPTIPQLILSCWDEEGVPPNKNRVKSILQSSFDGMKPHSCYPQRNGLLGNVMDAYAGHRHLILRPDDIWIAIITQFNFYVNANAKELRAKFVAHAGKKHLKVEVDAFDFRDISKLMADEIGKNVVDPSLKDWILPAFSTTTPTDTIVCAALMMSTLKSYFTYEGGITCGIPSITLEGTRQDWFQILRRLDKLCEFGEEAYAWAALLRPVLQEFVNAFDGAQNTAFWKRIVNVDEYCGGGVVGGWIALFSIWSDKGKWMGPDLPSKGPSTDYNTWARTSRPFILDLNYLPVGFCDVDLLLNDDGRLFPSLIVAGHMATLVEMPDLTTIRPQPGWFMILKNEAEESKVPAYFQDYKPPTSKPFQDESLGFSYELEEMFTDYKLQQELKLKADVVEADPVNKTREISKEELITPSCFSGISRFINALFRSK